MATSPTHACALVTGASSGLGEEFAVQLARDCARLVLVARREDRLQALAERLRAGHADLQVKCIGCDLAVEQARGDLLARLEGSEWQPDLLVNNAGLGDYGEVRSADWPRIRAMLDLNIAALTHLAWGFLPAMVQAGRGAVINVSSLAGDLPIPDTAVYAASKAYVSSFSEALRLEVREHGVSVVAVCPGPVHTEFGATATRSDGGGKNSMREQFYVAKEMVVADALTALAADRPRSYPGWRVKVLANVLGALPRGVVRCLMRGRPRRIPDRPS